MVLMLYKISLVLSLKQIDVFLLVNVVYFLVLKTLPLIMY